MSPNWFGPIELLLFYGVVLGWAGWQWWGWRRWRKQQDKQRRAAAEHADPQD